MKSVHLVQHVHGEDVKLIGVYATAQKAKAAVLRLGKQPGFSRSKKGFVVERYELNKDHWCEGFVTVRTR